jgi:hypothetical protein
VGGKKEVFGRDEEVAPLGRFLSDIVFQFRVGLVAPFRAVTMQMADQNYEEFALGDALAVEVFNLDSGAVEVFHADAVVTHALYNLKSCFTVSSKVAACRAEKDFHSGAAIACLPWLPYYLMRCAGLPTCRR